MKKNIKNNIVQKGGLMIEALAMLGLIAVVTPTMYKKSAERTLEVEDINTADTVRSYMGATEAYMAANYRGIIKEMTENEDGTPKENPDTVKLVNYDEDIKSYMPYGFQNGSSLYDYSSPIISIVRQGSNLTAYALFPAKTAGGLGQERTSRIASLIGANGGYSKADKSAHGIGGVWNLTANEVKDVFGTDSSNEFSLVTASSNVINSTSGAGQVENTKYLQRTKENTDELWRNAMRTDLYMGGGNPESDPDDSENIGNHSILNINNLIVGAEADIAGANNGLYIAGSWADKDNNIHENTNVNAYIYGTLTAAKEQLFADENKFAYGTPTQVTDGSGNVIGTDYRFEADKYGNITSFGSMAMGNMNNGNRNINGNVVTDYMIKGTLTEEGAKLSLMDENAFQITTDETEIDNGVDNVTGTHLMVENTGFKGADKVSNKDSLNEDIEPKYTKGQTFPVVVGSNAMVKGVLSAGQMDAQHLRTATISSGSENIDDDYKWMTVDKNGVVLKDIGTVSVPSAGGNGAPTTARGDGTYVRVNKKGVLMSTTSNLDANDDLSDSNNGALIKLSRRTNDENPYGDITIAADNSESAITTRNANISVQIKKNDLKIGNPDDDNDVLTYDDSVAIDNNPYRVVVGQGGNVDMVGANLKVMDSQNHNILSVKGNTNKESTAKFGTNSTIYNDFSSFAGANDIDYNITTHGNVLFSSTGTKKSSEITAYSEDDTIHYMAVGPNDEKAGVNIVESKVEGADIDDNSQRVVFVDLSAGNVEDNTYVDASGDNSAALKLTSDKIRAGTSSYDSLSDKHEVTTGVGTMKSGMVYVRKGLVDIVPDKGDVAAVNASGIVETRTDNSANEGSGIIRASRLVANNINREGKLETVPKIINDDTFTLYNGNNAVRYDTYMVNPAYTSVMKDIKLTTRGGARLSDILPDFIAKGLYLANNTYDDTMQRMQFTLKASTHGELELEGEPAETAAELISGSDSKYVQNNWASPYCGLVATPQCPPGYGRVITINPFRYEMAQAGQLALAAPSGYNKSGSNGASYAGSDGSGYFVSTSAMTSTLKRASYSDATKENLENELLVTMPQARKLKVKSTGTTTMKVSNVSGLKAGENPVVKSSDENATMSVASLDGMETYSDLPYNETNTTGVQGDGTDMGSTTQNLPSTYAITVGEYTDKKTNKTTSPLSPLVFQQSTWFHTHAVPVVKAGQEPKIGSAKGTYVGYNPDGSDYIRGWAVLQGFLYHYNEYKNFACPSGDCKALSPKEDETGNNEVMWNLFPVAKNSIGSYVNTYCYFDRQTYNHRKGLYSSYEATDDAKTGADIVMERYDLMDEIATDYKKGVTGGANDANRIKYYDQLNDPTMKYNELW